MDINASCLGPKQNFHIQISVLLKVWYETKNRKKKTKKMVLDFSKIEYYKDILDFYNIEYHITFLITQLPGQQCHASNTPWNLSTKKMVDC